MRDFLLEAKRSTVCHLTEKKAESAPQSHSKPPMSNEQFKKLQQQLENLSKRLAQTSKTSRKYSCPPCRTNSHSRSACPKPHCAYCRKNTHSLRNSTKGPPVGACFDCRRQNCRRGKPDCPGRHAAEFCLCGRISSPTITVALNGKILTALVDTGSERTLIRRSAVDRIGGQLNTMRALPNLQGVTEDPLRILGMSWVEVGKGDNKVSKQYFPVIPDEYLQIDLLLGCDNLGQATMTWCHAKRLLVWGGTLYVVNLVRK